MSIQHPEQQLLKVPPYQQEKSNWCWAACYQMIKYYRDGIKLEQRQIVQASGRGENNVPGSTGLIMMLADDNDDKVKIIHKSPQQMKLISNMLSAEEICQQITQGNPVLIVWKLTKTEAQHMVLICGWQHSEGDVLRFSVNNPDPGDSTLMKYEFLCNAIGTGTWTETLVGM